jgi:hypothetical protein
MAEFLEVLEWHGKLLVLSHHQVGNADENLPKYRWRNSFLNTA